MACRSGCRDQSHRSYGECLRSAGIRIGAQGHNFKATMSELDAYVDARRQGVQPATTSRVHTDTAMEVSQRTGRAFDAGGDG